MILTYKWDRFVLAIPHEKIHTLRRDTNRRWRRGMSIQHYLGNPRNGGQLFGVGTCYNVQDITLLKVNRSQFDAYIYEEGKYRELDDLTKKLLVANDFLSTPEFMSFFFRDHNFWVGRIIHFTDLNY